MSGVAGITVPMITIDQFLVRNPGPVSFVKIDVQGFELAVCRGMSSQTSRQVPCSGQEVGLLVDPGADDNNTCLAFVGKTGLKDGKGVMTSYRYIDGASVQPSDAEVKKLRPAD